MKKLLFFGIVAFAFASILFIPLPFMVPHLNKVTNDLILLEPKGTIWNGQVNHLTVNKYYLGKASWRFDPLSSLKTLSLKTKFTLEGTEINASGFAGITINNSITINNTEFDIDAKYVNSFQDNAKLSGSFNGFVEYAFLKQNEVPIIDGIINWKNGALDAPIKLDKGNYRAVLKPEDQNLDIKLSSEEAPIELNGNIKLQKDWVFNTNISAKSKNAGLTTLMKFAGKPQADGTILIKQKGDLKPFLGLN